MFLTLKVNWNTREDPDQRQEPEENARREWTDDESLEVHRETPGRRTGVRNASRCSRPVLVTFHSTSVPVLVRCSDNVPRGSGGSRTCSDSASSRR